MAFTSLEICARALIRIGAAPITSFTDGSAEADMATLLYDQVRTALLSAYPWSFAMRQATLVRNPTAPIADYLYAYDLPGDCLRVWSAGSPGSGSGLRYRLLGGKLHTNAESVVLTYIGNTAEADVPPFFNAVLIAKLAAEFCIPLTESTSRAESLSRLAEQELQRAKLYDAQQDTPPSLQSFSLTEGR